MTTPSALDRSFSRRRALALLGTSAGIHWVQPASAAWKVVKVGEHEYVTAKDIKEFYKFSTLERSDAEAVLRSVKLIMRLRLGSHEMHINKVKFMLNRPTTSQGEDLLVSRIDLVELIDPVLRPGHIASAISFTKVVIDPGHGGHDLGAIGLLGNEKTYALDTSLRLAEQLRSHGFQVVMSRSTDADLSLAERVAVANATPDCMFLSIHFGDGQPGACGIASYALAPPGTNRSSGRSALALATAVHSQILVRTRSEDRGIGKVWFAELQDSKREGILIEGGCLSDPEEGARINQPEYRDRLARAIAEGVVQYRRAIDRAG